MPRAPEIPPTVSPTCRVLVARSRQPLAVRASIATTFASRLIGLLGRKRLEEGEALVLPRCRTIHTIGMRFPIDAVFVDRAWRVVALYPDLAPGRVVRPVWRAWGAVELASGTLARVGLHVGDQLQIGEDAADGGGA